MLAFFKVHLGSFLMRLPPLGVLVAVVVATSAISAIVIAWLVLTQLSGSC